jgi:hypothetical protein
MACRRLLTQFAGAAQETSGPRATWAPRPMRFQLLHQDKKEGPALSPQVGLLSTNLGATGALYNLTMDPYEKYDMIFNGRRRCG